MTQPSTLASRRLLPPLLRLAGAVLPVSLAATIASRATTPNIAGWYQGLAKPAFNPPDGLFPIAWTILYPMIALALWRLLGAMPEAGAARRAWGLALAAFLVQLALNAAWPIVFFANHAIGPGLAVVTALLAAILATIGASLRVDRLAAGLLAPYAAWVAFATLLNAAIWRLN